MTKIPKWAFEKFPEAEDVLGTQMKSVGEVMAIGRTFKEALFKGLRSLEAVKPLRLEDVPDDELQRKLARPNSQRFSYITYALQHGYSIDEIHRLSQDRSVVSRPASAGDGVSGRASTANSLQNISDETLATCERVWPFRSPARFSDRHDRRRSSRAIAKALGIVPVYKRVDTCGAEFESFTPYLYSTYEEECEAAPTTSERS